MANQSTRETNKLNRKAGKHFHGQPCVSSFTNKSGANKRKSAWRGCPEARRKD